MRQLLLIAVLGLAPFATGADDYVADVLYRAAERDFAEALTVIGVFGFIVGGMVAMPDGQAADRAAGGPRVAVTMVGLTTSVAYELARDDLPADAAGQTRIRPAESSAAAATRPQQRHAKEQQESREFRVQPAFFVRGHVVCMSTFWGQALRSFFL